ncbi:FG-GAP-like repeat-containing protein [Fulvivirgaceae bacterium BMA12]|uniref:FG-GAP-like repeat-containing protein n=1 Tax=Agaribacillus aureus TaxID=3051825 RepID=A0ABT8L565_9BACT|nr:FG-GAP-like repeat-containing protein [Fulvivirgaceae bacterium BMA12]
MKFFIIGVFVCCLITELKAQEFTKLSLFGSVSDTHYANGISVADYDADGDLDIFIVARNSFDKLDPKTWNRLYENRVGTFVDVTQKSGLHAMQYSANGKILREGIKMGAGWGDYDNDGYPDLFLTNQGKDQLWHNMGNGTFENVTDIAGVAGPEERYSSSILWWDYDNDGDLDLYVSSWEGGGNGLYRNDGGHNFADVSEASGLANIDGSTWTSIPLDVNKDGWQDIYLVNDFQNNLFYLNMSDGHFEDATGKYNLYDSGNGMGVDICDFNNDGNFDIYLTNISQLRKNPFFINTGGTFANKSRELGVDDAKWGWACRFIDFDHDMDEDLYVVNQEFFNDGVQEYNRFYELTGGKFKDNSVLYGLDNVTDSRTMEVFDYNTDGDLDIILGNWGEEVLIFDNQSQNKKNWIQIKLEGTVSNKNAFGTVIRIKTPDDVYQHRLYHGINFLGQSIKPIHFGLARNKKIDELTLFWPSGKVEKIYDVSANQLIKFKEGEQEEVFGEAYGTDDNNIVTSLDQLSYSSGAQLDLQIFPNPFTDNSTLRLYLPKPGNAQLKIHDTLGRKIYQKNFSIKTSNIDINWPENLIPGAGTFFCQVITEGGRIVKKVLKR